MHGGRAFAQTSPTTDITAQALFDAGMKLVDQKRYSEACPKLAASAKIDPAWGTLLNLADCYEKNGQTASAWITFKNAEVAARDANQPKFMSYAHDHAANLESKLSRVQISATTPVEGMIIKRDGAFVSTSEWGVAIPADPGSHTLEVSAPQRKTWTATFTVSADGATTPVVIPTLEVTVDATPPGTPAASPAVTTPVVSTPPPKEGGATSGGMSTQKTIAIVVGAVGVVGIIVGTVEALSAKSSFNDSLSHCLSTDQNMCDATGVSQRNDARRAGNVATVGFGVGALGLVSGVVLWLTAPSSIAASRTASRTETTTASIHVVPTLGGAMMTGSW